MVGVDVDHASVTRVGVDGVVGCIDSVSDCVVTVSRAAVVCNASICGMVDDVVSAFVSIAGVGDGCVVGVVDGVGVDGDMCGVDVAVNIGDVFVCSCVDVVVGVAS